MVYEKHYNSQITIKNAMFRTLSLSLSIILCYTFAVASSSFSTMSVAEVSELLDAAPAKDAAAGPIRILPGSAKGTVELTARDMMKKVYGVLDECNSMQECMASSRAHRLVPEKEDDVLWLEPSGGYFVDYYGLMPQVSALAHFGNGPEAPVSDYGYFFLFPYTDASDDAQTNFTSLLLQEMHDLGMMMSMRDPENADALFAAVGDYEGNLIDVRLLDNKGENGSGRYILVLSVEPGESVADNLMAAE